jgi:hypothetical protein
MSQIDGAAWRKSSYSSSEGQCVEVTLSTVIGVRDTKDRSAGHISVAPKSWSTFIAKVTKS